ncbi:hypothetical protein [Legionella jordanis]|uniref:hypothetical protein n=1 Tax=Legionella jordanis TaxID=456 RepID=UPI0016052827|nr:hypothetical protein [Legionella jordanis]
MPLYKLINKRLRQAGLLYPEEQLQEFDIIEYMVLESVGALHPLQGKALKCVFRPGHTSNMVFEDGKKRSSLEFGLWDCEPSTSNPELIQFANIVRAIEDKYPNSSSDDEHRFYNIYKTIYAVIITDEDIEKAITSSSLFAAAGDLSEFNLESLLLLRLKLNLYKITDERLSILVDRLADEVSSHLTAHFDENAIQKALPQAEEQFQAMLAISEEERKFNRLLTRLNYKLHALIDKGREAYDNGMQNEDYDPSYSKVADIAQLLRSTLIEARDQFFNNPVSQTSFKQFKQTCLDAIENSKDEFAKFRGWAKWYNELNPVLKALLLCLKGMAGIIAGLTVIPAVCTEIYSTRGYIGTFFNNKTESYRTLNVFAESLCAAGGILDGLEENIPSMEKTI